MFHREQKVFKGGEANNGALPCKLQGDGVDDELHHGSSKESEVSVGALAKGLPQPYELVNGQLYKWD